MKIYVSSHFLKVMALEMVKRPGLSKICPLQKKENLFLTKSMSSTNLNCLNFVKFAEFDEIMHSDPENLKNIVSKVLTWLVRTRWRRAIWGTLSVIKCMLNY